MEEIKNQLIFLLGSFLSGILVMLAYEAVNIFRGLFRPGVFGRLFLDVVFFYHKWRLCFSNDFLVQ